MLELCGRIHYNCEVLTYTYGRYHETELSDAAVEDMG